MTTALALTLFGPHDHCFSSWQPHLLAFSLVQNNKPVSLSASLTLDVLVRPQ